METAGLVLSVLSLLMMTLSLVFSAVPDEFGRRSRGGIIYILVLMGLTIVSTTLFMRG